MPVLIPALTITATANTSAAAPGAAIGYTVTVTDSGQTPYTGATFTDSLAGALDDASYDGDAAATAGSVTYSSPNLTWTGNLAVGATATITFSVTVNSPDTGDKVIVTAITSSTVGSTCPPGGQSPGCTVTVAGLTPALTIAQTASSGTTTPGAVVHYTVTVTDSGQTAYTGASVSVSLAGVLDDAAYQRRRGRATGGAVSFASPSLTWTGNLAAGATATITYLGHGEQPGYRRSHPVQHGHFGRGRKQLRGREHRPALRDRGGRGGADDRGQLERARPRRRGRWSGLPTVFTNSGQVPYTGITIASNISDVLDDATPNGDQTATSGTLTVTSTGLSWTGDIPVGGSVTITGTVTVDNPDPGNKVMTSIFSTAAAGSNCPAGGTDPRCSTTVTVLVPALSIVQSANATSAVPGQVIGYTLTVTNTGQTPYTGAAVTDSFAEMLDDAGYDGDASATAGTVSYASPVLTWTGDLAPGASAVITFTVTVDNPDTGDKLVITTVTSAATGSTCPPGTTSSRCQVTVPVLTPALTIVKTASTATPAPGQQVTYTLTVTDTGQTPYTGASLTDPLAGVLDDAVYNNDAAATAGTVSYHQPAT